MNLRLKNIYAKLDQENLDSIIISSPANISYLTKYPSRDSYLLISKRKNLYFTDSRYVEEAARPLKGIAEIKQTNGSVFKIVAKSCLKLGLEKIAFEERILPFAEYKKLTEGLRKRAKLIPAHSLIEGLRQVKETQEVEKMKKAIKITTSALKFIEKTLVLNMKEIEVVAELERFIRYHGANNAAFDIIVASGPNSGFPHHIPGQRKIKKNEPILVDIGVDYLGYKSDLTRVFFLGKITTLAKRIYQIVLKAQERAIKKIKPGVPIKEIDSAARQYITQKGYGGFFGHNLGHGIGLEIHEEPEISSSANSLLKANMVFTIEPGIYIPNKFGIRIEDMVKVAPGKCEVLSSAVNK